MDARALRQAVQLEDGHVEAEEVIAGGLREPQAHVEELRAAVQAQDLPGAVEGQPPGQAEAQRLVDLP